MTTIERLCGFRAKGGIYSVHRTSEYGVPLEHFLIDPPIITDTGAFGLSPVGVTLIEKNGVTHILDWVGELHYPNVADFIEETRRYGMSRRLPRSLAFEKLTRQSRHYLVHSRAYITSFEALVKACGHEHHTCPKGLEHHAWPDTSEACIGLVYEDVSALDSTAEAPGPDRAVCRHMPTFEYRARRAPTGIRVLCEPAIFLALPIQGIEVVRAPDDLTHDIALEKAQKSSLPVVLTDD